MSFQERFRERATFMNKEGVIGVVSQTALPIEKTPANSQLNYFNASQRIQNKTNNVGFREAVKSDSNRNVSREASFALGLKNEAINEMSPPRKDSSRGNFFKANGNLTLQTDFSKSLLRNDTFLNSRTPQARAKQQNSEPMQYQKLQQSVIEQPRPLNKEIVFTNIQNPQQLKQKQHYTKLSASSIIQPQQQPRVRVTTHTGGSLQNIVPSKPTYSLIPTPQHARGFQINPMINFDNQYISKYKEYEFSGSQKQGQQTYSQMFRMQQQQQQASPERSLISVQARNETTNTTFKLSSRGFSNQQPMGPLIKTAQSMNTIEVQNVTNRMYHKGHQSEAPSPIFDSQKTKKLFQRKDSDILIYNENIDNGVNRRSNRLSQYNDWNGEERANSLIETSKPKIKAINLLRNFQQVKG